MAQETDVLRNRQLEMVGRLLAGFSHELKNHLAIIKESNGLIVDLLMMGRIEEPTLKGKLEKITATINRRTMMVAEMTRHLNGFAHRNDTPLSPFPLQDVLQEELAFLTRAANMKSIGLVPSFPDALPVVYGNPGLLQFVFASCFLHILPSLRPGGEIRITAGQQGRFVAFTLETKGETSETVSDPAAVNADPALQEALRQLGAALSLQSGAGRILAITCTLPLSAAPEQEPCT